MFNKKIITALILLNVFIVGLQMAEPVNAAAKDFDSGSFKVNGEKITYVAFYGLDSKNEVTISFYKNDYERFKNSYSLKKVSKNQIKSYQVTYDKKENPNRKFLKNHKTTKSTLNFYKNNYKKYIINEFKSKMLKK